jgi:hypothetical protein
MYQGSSPTYVMINAWPWQEPCCLRARAIRCLCDLTSGVLPAPCNLCCTPQMSTPLFNRLFFLICKHPTPSGEPCSRTRNINFQLLYMRLSVSHNLYIMECLGSGASFQDTVNLAHTGSYNRVEAWHALQGPSLQAGTKAWSLLGTLGKDPVGQRVW